MLRIALCDDAPQFLRQLYGLLEYWPHRPNDIHVDTFGDADSLMSSHRNAPYDIILMDIVMPLLNGIEAAKELRQSDDSVRIVFLTTSTEFAIDAFAVHASHYLLKPVEPKALYDCLDRLCADISKQTEYLVVRSNVAVHRIPLQDIEVIEAHQKHSLITLISGEMIHAVEPLYYFEEKLLANGTFFKCHRSYIINLFRIRTYTQKELQMRSGYRIPISRNSHKEFETAYFSLLFDHPADTTS